MALFLVCASATAQNTKGDRPVKNQRQIRETKVKSVRRKEKGGTRDIANRRLRTRGKSSANRANANYPRETPYYGRKKKEADRSAGPRGRVFSKSPRESKVHAWKGDVSGYPLKRIKPTGSDAARNNVYPQKGPYVRFARKQPKKKPPVYSRTIKGNRFVRHEPRYQERAWKDGIDNGPIRNQSATGTAKNTYSQKGPYVRYYRKNLSKKERPLSNSKELSRARRLTHVPKTGGAQGNVYPLSVSKPYLQRGKKNVYWGKFSRKEKGVTRDLTGGPLRTRNYKSMPAGLVGRDTVKFFGRKPKGDRPSRFAGGGYKTATKKGQRGWRGDVAGWRLRKPGGKGETAGESLYPRLLSVFRKTEEAGQRIQGGGYQTKPRRGEKAQLNSIPGKVYSNQLGGKIKGVRKTKGGGSVSGALWNNQGRSIRVRAPGRTDAGIARFSGTFRIDQVHPGFSRQGTGYAGNVKRSSLRGFSKNGVDYSGRIKRSTIPGYGKNGVDYSGRIKRGTISGFAMNGVDYSGRIKRSTIPGYGKNGVDYTGRIKRSTISGFSKNGVDYSGRIKRNTIPGFGKNGVDYSGNLRRGELGGFTRQGIGFAGNIKGRRPAKGGGSVSGKLWNNRNQAVTQKRISSAGLGAQRYSGDILLIGPVKSFEQQGEGYSGNIRRSDIQGFDKQGAGFSGNIKAKRPEKGGGSVSGKLWNNDNKAIISKTPKSKQGADFAGNIKFRKPDKGGGSVSGELWNNNNEALKAKPPKGDDAKAIEYSGKIAISRFKRNYIQNPNASDESLKKQKPDKTTYRVAGLQVKVRGDHYSRKPNASKYALPGIAPSGSSVKASEYARGMKQYWNYKHNPNSAQDALKVIAPGKAMARINDFQGNTKMHKYSGSRLHPDAAFAHGYRDNIKEERTLFMNIRLTWAKLFRKSENQPENLKEKTHRPRYDKREKGMWND